MTDSGNVVLALVAAIWARENARSAGFERLNRIRDCIVTGYINDQELSGSYRQLMYESDWRSQATGVTTVTFLFALIVGGIPFLIESAGDWPAVLCGTVALYQVASGVFTWRTFAKDARYMRAVLTQLPDQASLP